MTLNPPAVEAAWQKSRRAMNTGLQLDVVRDDFAASEPFRVETDPHGKERVRRVAEPPIDVSILTGEILYQVRSSLDHLFFALVERNHPGAAMPPRWQRDTQFPLMTKRPDGAPKTGPLERRHFPKPQVMAAVTDRAFQFIESIQPYHSRRDDSFLLKLLTTFSNIDKHRRLNACVIRATSSEELTTAEGYTSTSMSILLKDGDVLPSAWHSDDMRDRAVKTTRELTPEIMFDEPELGPPQVAPLDKITELPRFMIWWLIPNMAELIKTP